MRAIVLCGTRWIPVRQPPFSVLQTILLDLIMVFSELTPAGYLRTKRRFFLLDWLFSKVCDLLE